LTVRIFMGMDIDRFYLVVRKVLEKKYPWINDIVVTHDYDDDGRHLFGLEVHVDKKFRDSEVFMDKHEVDVEDDVKSMFDMMGPEKWEKFNRVTLF
jgi:hypothetical protein